MVQIFRIENAAARARSRRENEGVPERDRMFSDRAIDGFMNQFKSINRNISLADA